MKLQFLFDLLTWSELKELSIFDKITGTDEDEKELAERTVLNYINLGILDLHKHLPIKVEESELTLKDGQNFYYLLDSNIGDYLTSLPGEVLHILAVFNEDGESIPLNDNTYENSIFTPAYNKLQVPNAIDYGTKLYVTYQASEAPIPYIENLMDIEIPISPVLLEALTLFVGYKLHTAQDGNIQQENNTFYVRYNKEIQTIKTSQDLVYRIENRKDTLLSKGFK
jgi:hypothetical protein